MKKTAYLAPESTIIEGEVTEMICSSITSVDGDAGIMRGDDSSVPNVADSRSLGLWEEEDEENW